MLYRVAIVTVLALSACAAPQRIDSAVEPLVEKAALVETLCNGERMGWGSATAMTSQTFLTAAHVVDDIPSGCVIAVTHGGHRWVAQVYSLDEAWDLATLYVPGASSKPRATFTRQPRLGEDVTCVGYPVVPVSRDDDGNNVPILSVVKGNIATVGLPRGLVRFTAPSMPGISGGGCFGSDDALVIVVQAGHFPYGIPIDGMYYGRAVR